MQVWLGDSRCISKKERVKTMQFINYQNEEYFLEFIQFEIKLFTEITPTKISELLAKLIESGLVSSEIKEVNGSLQITFWCDQPTKIDNLDQETSVLHGVLLAIEDSLDQEDIKTEEITYSPNYKNEAEPYWDQQLADKISKELPKYKDWFIAVLGEDKWAQMENS